MVGGQNSLRPPAELTIISKTLLNLDKVGETLDPDFDPGDVFFDHMESLMRRHLLDSLTMGNFFATVLELEEFVQKLPGRANSIMDALSRNEVSMKIDAIDEEKLVSNLQKIANRITMGLVLAALIVGAALIMHIETKLTIFGYPALAFVLFLVAAVFGFGLVLQIYRNDQ